MATEAHSRPWRTSVERALAENAARQQYEQRLREIRRGPRRSEERPRPLEFDESGFPIPQPAGGFVQRVGRLLNGD